MFNFSIFRRLFTLLTIGVATQIVTVITITLSTFKRRHRRGEQHHYNTIALEPLVVADAALQLYMEGESLFADMEAAIANAEKRIFFETFIWVNDVLGDKFRELLIEKARSGVEVYIVYDLLGNGVFGGSALKFPTDIATLHVAPYFPFRRLYYLFRPSRYNVTHRKLLVVDDQIGFVGGYNLGEAYRTKWRDTHLRVAGIGAHELAYAFVDFWNHYTAHTKKLPVPAVQWSSVLDVYRNDPLRRNFPIRGAYLHAIERAQSHIYITNAYFVPDGAFRQAIKEAARRGVDVQVVLPWQSNHLVVDWISRHWFADYLEAGVKIFGYEAAMIHTKSVTIDGEWSTIGTANLDRLSLLLNHEVNAMIFDTGVAAQMEAIFACDKLQARKIELAEWKNRPIRDRLGEAILAPLWPFI